ncbi:MAG: response regulator [bacterium]|nr:response regulator [bacterium]
MRSIIRSTAQLPSVTSEDLKAHGQLPDYRRLHTILVIEDMAELNDSLATRLRGEGLDVVSSYDGVTGLELFRELDPDLVILDLALPRQSGFKLLHELRMSEGVTDTPVVVMTSNPDPAIDAKARGWGVRRILRKPVRQRDVVATVLEILEQ